MKFINSCMNIFKKFSDAIWITIVFLLIVFSYMSSEYQISNQLEIPEQIGMIENI